MLALALPLPILVGEVCGPLPLPYLILELVGGQVTGRRGDWAEDADAHPVGLIASPSYHQIPKHLFDIHLAVGRWWDGNRRLGRGRDAQSLSTVVPLGPPWNQPLPPRICLRTHGTGLLEKKQSADIFETYL